MNLVDLKEQRKALLLKKSKGNATEDDLKQLAKVLDLINSNWKSSEEAKKAINKLFKMGRQLDNFYKSYVMEICSPFLRICTFLSL